MLKRVKSTLIMIQENVVMSIDNIVGNKTRSFLTMLGIMIGVMAVITLISTVKSVSGSLTSMFEDLGANALTISLSGTEEKRGITTEELATIEGLPQIAGTIPTISTRAHLVYDGRISEDAMNVSGKNAYYGRITKDLLLRGRLLNALDDRDRTWVCMVSEDVVKELFFARDPLDETVYVDGLPFTIVGLFDAEKDTSIASLMGGTADVIIPYTTAMRLNSTNVVSGFTAYMSEGIQSAQAQRAVEEALDPMFSYEEDAYAITSMESIQKSMEDMLGMMSTMLAGIASIALVVGGIGIMNMMLTTVTERTMEIGLKKALGAMPWQIQLQFLIESFLLSLMGGVAGILLGLGVSFGLAKLLSADFVLSWGAVSLGVGFSAAVGIFFGWAPARKASRLNPIDALRAM